MKNTALLVVDVQNGLMDEGPYQGEQVLKNIEALIPVCRENDVEVIYIRHDGGKGSELEPGTGGFEICARISPQSDEKIFTKTYNSAFLKTGLKDYLTQKGIREIILVGMQTEYCIDSTCKTAFELGFRVLIPEGTFTTFDNGPMRAAELCEFYSGRIWDRRFASVIPFKDLAKLISA
ncbi:cysteine hydrolase family protein [Caproicibacter fermentans]|uniref:Cysteine hydrolase n=1 Tax=Caproicibacter fermentans TaxID=2576756 RepID=A0A7G8T9V1_9FIRM|nr:cysteine hydrolase family protein [Caproicibacter fermentans]QNK40392.1 cysteine hydrolase [Caproicibacter fermentans]